MLVRIKFIIKFQLVRRLYFYINCIIYYQYPLLYEILLYLMFNWYFLLPIKCIRAFDNASDKTDINPNYQNYKMDKQKYIVLKLELPENELLTFLSNVFYFTQNFRYKFVFLTSNGISYLIYDALSIIKINLNKASKV